jgi:hypothetical protein
MCFWLKVDFGKTERQAPAALGQIIGTDWDRFELMGACKCLKDGGQGRS